MEKLTIGGGRGGGGGDGYLGLKSSKLISKRSFKKISGSMLAGSGYKGITEIKGNEHELLFHPHFNYNVFTSLEYC